ncbi:hypothetical protein [Singulisphaera acidiphila]|uniref:hypothetical protein n=1 Tax=Singulisphaera acidiphila TaxID=466153 RepID=UPI000380F31C|nr:hypothetical protein [Singulisphaera acidiphila]
MITEITAEDILSWCEVPELQYVETCFGHARISLLSKHKEIPREEIHANVIGAVKREGRNAAILKMGDFNINCNDVINAWQKEFIGTEKELDNGLLPGDPPVKRRSRSPSRAAPIFLEQSRGGSRSMRFVSKSR